MTGHSVIVAILATIGRSKGRTTGRAVMPLTVRGAEGMACLLRLAYGNGHFVHGRQ